MTKTSFPKENIKVLLLEGIHPAAIDIFKNAGYANIEPLSGALSEEELIDKISDVHILGIRSKTQVTEKVFAAAPRLLTMGCFCIGVNQVNMAAATDAGVAVFNSPFSNTRSVAELVIANTIMLMRRIFEKNDAAHKGLWLKDSKECYEVRGKTIGIIGYGHIGSQVSVMAEALGMKVLYYDVEAKQALGNAQSAAKLEELLKVADIVTLHVPGTIATKNMITSERLKLLKKGAILLNLSRGDVMNMDAVTAAVKNKHLGGLAVDVFPVEPENKGDVFSSPLQGLSNVILTPHIGGSTIEAQYNIGFDVAHKLIDYVDKGSTMGSLSVPELSLPLQHNAHRLLHIHRNRPGVLSEINSILGGLNVNILGQYLQTNASIGYVVLDIDKKTPPKVLGALHKVKHTIKLRSLY